MITQTTMRTVSRHVQRVILICVTAALPLLLALMLLFTPTSQAAHAQTERTVTTSYTTTDKLYLQIPEEDKKGTFTTPGGYSGGKRRPQTSGGTTYFYTVNDDPVTASLSMRSWYDIYIAPVNASDKWNVATADATDGKYYYDATKYPLKKNTSYALFIDIREMPKTSVMYSYLCTPDDYTWQPVMNTSGWVYCSRVEKSYDPNGMTPTVTLSGVSGSVNPFTDSRVANMGETTHASDPPYSFSDFRGRCAYWMSEPHNMDNCPLGINPVTGAKSLFTFKSDSGERTLTLSYAFGAMRNPTNCENYADNEPEYNAPLAAAANRAPAKRETIEIEFNTTSDSTAPTITPSDTVSKTSVSATFKDNAFVFATYTKNGVSQGEYTSGTKLTAEGRYAITATDAAGNKTVSENLYVDKTAPKFAEGFYDAQGKALIKYTKDNSYVLPFPTAGDNESAINERATFVYSYYDSAANKVISMPAEYYNSGGKLTKEGRYVITVSDAAGNSSSCTVIVDRSAPELKGSEYSNANVAASYSASEAESPIDATYIIITSSGTSEVRSYASGLRLTTEGRYDITATDRAGNTATKTLYVDKTAPTLTRSFEYGAENGSAIFSYAAHESPVTATYTYLGESGSIANVPYMSGQALVDDGAYTITATDGAGNVTSTKIVVDRKAPTFVFADGTTGAAQITKDSSSVAWTVAAYESPVTTVYSFASTNETLAPSIDAAPYSSASSITAEGTYSFTATDRAGNVARASIIIDRTAPSLVFHANGVPFERYTNAPFTTVGTDALSGVDRIELYEGGEYVPYDYAPRSENGAYLFRVTDKAGNYTVATATVFKTDSFGNVDTIRDGYKLNAWYTVTLPARIFSTDNNDVAGRYSFESYDSALVFAMQKEREFRVTAVQGGFMYVSASNESVAQKYDTEESVAAVVEKYARGYISVRQTSNASGNDRYYVELESLTRNTPDLPDYLLDYKDLPRHFARPSVVWSLPNVPYITDMPYAVTACYLGDFDEETAQDEFAITSGATLLSSAVDYKQGWYLITERDGAGNVERYLIYSDAELPTVGAVGTRGDGQEELTLDYAYTQNETLYFLSLELNSLFDNVDPYVTLKLEKGNSITYFTQSDELPVLGSDEFTSGKYTVTVFDRSLNALVFEVFIAGAAPTMTHGSLVADRPDCRLSFVTSDRYNVITGITLYKIEYDGSKTVLDTDGNGTPISAATLSYTLTVGGKYGATITDNFRRTVELPSIFFLKGLPGGKLSGVSDGGRTNRNVSFTFDSGDACELFVLLPGGERRTFTSYAVQTGAAQTTYNITAEDATSFEYLVFLHNASDRSLFVEYTFEIDTILPVFEITDSDGNVIEPDGATNKSFSIKWQETGVTVRYYTARSGGISATKYNMNAVMSQGTLYYFTLKDDVGNTLDFTVLLDNAVDYTLSGNCNEVDGVLYSNKPVTFTVNEPTQVFDVANADGNTLENGGTMMHAGRYEITVTDNYRNTVTLCIVLDFTPPTLTLVGAENGGAVKNDVVVSAFDYDYLFLADAKGNKIRDVADGELFSESGRYSLIASDYAGNSAVASFSIDLSVDYTLSVPNGAVTTDKVTLDTAEPLTVDVRCDDVHIDMQSKFTEPGMYELTLTDELGNTAFCVFVILPQRVRMITQALPIGTFIAGMTSGGQTIVAADAATLELDTTGVYSITLDCSGVSFELELEVDNTPPVVTIERNDNTVKIAASNKENVAIVVACDGSKSDGRIGQTFDEPGHYVITVTDDLGNVAMYEFDIPYRLNTWAIVAIVVGAVLLVGILILVIRARRKPRMK